jgi:hypothetical protein
VKVGDRVLLVDTYASRVRRLCGPVEASWFNGLRGVVTRVEPTVMVHLEGERLPMVFDERDIVRADAGIE